VLIIIALITAIVRLVGTIAYFADIADIGKNSLLNRNILHTASKRYNVMVFSSMALMAGATVTVMLFQCAVSLIIADAAHLAPAFAIRRFFLIIA
jgi:hypothetical protein